VQTFAQAGYSSPQDLSTYPHGKGAIQKPVAKALRATDLSTELIGENPWTIRGGWKLAAAPNAHATGEEISQRGFSTKDWLAATVPGTALTTMIDRGIYPIPTMILTISRFRTASHTRSIGIETLPKSDRSEADVEIEAPLTNTTDAAIDGDLTASFDNITVIKHVHLAPGQSVVRIEPADYAQLKVQSPRLWWPNGYGEPVLHTLRVRFSIGGKNSAASQIDFVMREVSYETSLFDKTGHLRRLEVFPARTHDAESTLIDESHEGIRQIDDQTPNQMPPGQALPEFVSHAWVHPLAPGAEDSPSIKPVEGGWPGTDIVIKLNGVRIAARGGNWGMDDSRKRVSVEHLEPYFHLHREAHVNIIRNWMGQDTEESFYALADKYGLMVSNDFWDSTQNYNLVLSCVS